MLTLKTEEDNGTHVLIMCLADLYKGMATKKEIIKSIEINLDTQKEYENFMKSKQFATFEIPFNHRYLMDLSTKLNPTATKKIMLEITNFRKNLPVNWGSTVFVRISQKNLNLFTFWITGPKDTPYENMFMEYHASYPSNYPDIYPKVLLHTTGNDTFRFNPNLYKEGKVCLSLLGTWSGDASETWNPAISTMYTVITSIQAQIMGMDEPYFNEPGYEKSRGTPEGQKNSQTYNEIIYPESIKWGIIDMIKNPPATMEDVIKTHFKMKKDEITETTLKWLNNMDNKIKTVKDPQLEARRNNLFNVRNEMLKLFIPLSDNYISLSF
jgi:baculoviral IAP repeat-containing protein 6